jgi:hypothetical protein
MNVSQHRRHVLADVVIARPLPERFGALVVMAQGELRDPVRIMRLSVHFGAPFF